MAPASTAPSFPRAMLFLTLALAAALSGCANAPESAATSDAGGASAPATSPDSGPAPAAAAASVPHLHDYWSGRERVTLFNEDITVEPQSALVWGALTTRFLGETAFGGAFVTFPEGALVYEGTGRMEITVVWTDPSITGMRFLHRHAGSGELQPWTEAPNGETLLLDVTPEMTDMPHAETSRWGFLMAASGTPAVAIGTFHVQIDIVKTRDVAEWPAHPDLWEGRERLTLADAEGHAAARVVPLGIAASDPWAVPGDAIPSERLVPMDAATLRVTVTILEIDDRIALDRLVLLARTADDVEFDFDDEGEPADVSADGLTWTWERAVEMDETDNVYATASAWAFRVVAAAAPAPLPFCDDGCYEAEVRYHLEAVVDKAAAEA